MARYILRRMFQMFITLLLFQAATFFLLLAQPTDIADLLTSNPDIPPAEGDRLRQELGLDKPPIEQFTRYIGNFYQGKLGLSFSNYPKPVADIIMERLPRTLVLFLTSTIISFWTGFASGKVLAWRRGGFVEYASTIIGVILYTVFTPWFALMMIWLFATKLDDWTNDRIDLPAGKFTSNTSMWFTADIEANQLFIQMIITAFLAFVLLVLGLVLASRVDWRFRPIIRLLAYLVPVALVWLYWYRSPYGNLAFDILKHMILPVMTVTLIAYGGTMLLMRTSMLETLREDYILTARAKGLPDKVIRDKHAARNALLPVWTGLVFAIGSSIGGGIIIETIFSWPGIGQALLNATVANDIPLVMGTLTMLGVMTLVSHLVADVGYAFLDPRVRIDGGH